MSKSKTLSGGWSWLCLVAALGLIVARPGAVRAAADVKVFDAPPADTIPVLREGVPTRGGPLRVLSVEERVGVERKQSMVRVPLFFHPGECADPNGLVIYEAADTAKAHPIPYQADDIRRTSDGKVARMHIYFFTDLKAWEHRKFDLFAGKNAAASMKNIEMTESGQQAVFSGEALKVAINVKGPKAGGITLIESPFGRITAIDELAPWVKLIRQNDKLKEIRTSDMKYDNPASFEVRQIQYASGPLFAKVRFRIGPPGVPDNLETTYLFPRYGSEIIATYRMFPDEQDTPESVGAKWPVWLWGHCKFGDDPQSPEVISVPAGLRELTRNVHGFVIESAASQKAGFSFMHVPYTAFGGRGVYTHENGELVFIGPSNMTRGGASNSGNLRSWWYQARYVMVPTLDKEKLYETAKANEQSLTAVVDEPGLTVDDYAELVKPVAQTFWDIKYWGRGWQQTAAMQYLSGDMDACNKTVGKVANGGPPKEGKTDDTMLEGWMPKWAVEQMNEGKTIPFKRPKGSDRDVAGKLDPYTLGYGAGSIADFARYIMPTERMDKICYAIGKASMYTNCGVDGNLFPMVRSFSNAYNMQLGTIIFAIYGGQKLNDAPLVQFARDVTHRPGSAAIYGRGQRCYSNDIRSQEPSDLLYEAITDMWLRVAELIGNDDLMIHPAVFGRYVDCIDVTADLQHHRIPADPAKSDDQRANFLRGQSHDHRWEAWETAPFAMLIRDADQTRSPVGLTEALYYLRRQAGRRANWSGLMHYFHPLVMMRTGMAQYQPPKLPPLPTNVKVTLASGANNGMDVTWDAVPGDIQGYRIYRAGEKGDALTFVNSPYQPTNNQLVKETHFHDPNGGPKDFYFITAIDAKGYESCWFPDEPRPVAGKP